jgi:hypothetical protein
MILLYSEISRLWGLQKALGAVTERKATGKTRRWLTNHIVPPLPTTNHLREWPEHGQLYVYAFISILVLCSDFILLRKKEEVKYPKCAMRNKRLSNICSKVTFKNDIDKIGLFALWHHEWKLDKINTLFYFILFFLWCYGPTRAMASWFLRFLDSTQRRTTSAGLLWTSDQLVA